MRCFIAIRFPDEVNRELGRQIHYLAGTDRFGAIVIGGGERIEFTKIGRKRCEFATSGNYPLCQSARIPR